MKTKSHIDILRLSGLQPEPTEMNSGFFVGTLGPKSSIECDRHGDRFIFFTIRTGLLHDKPQTHMAVAWNNDADTIAKCKRGDGLTIAGSLRIDGPDMLEAEIDVETIVQVKPVRSVQDLIESVSNTSNLVYLVGTLRRAHTTDHPDGHHVNVLSLSTGFLPDDQIKVVFNSCFDVERSIPVGTLVAATGSLAHKTTRRKSGSVATSFISAEELRVVEPGAPALAIRRLQVSLN
jgi:hypothetical protein